MAGLKVFIVHGRDSSALEQLQSWFRRRRLAITFKSITFAELAMTGETVPLALERIATLGDAAIVLDTPDDLGGLRGESGESRARQNVWVELDWFWGRLGLRRTLLLVKEPLKDIPSDIAGLMPVHFKDNVREVSEKLTSFLSGLQTAAPDLVTELVSAAADSGSRTVQYQSVWASAASSIVVTGIGMINVRHHLPELLGNFMKKKPHLTTDFILLDKQVIEQKESLLSIVYRPSLKNDITAFEDELARQLDVYPDVSERVRFYRYPGLMTFSATVADPEQFGSLMLAETILPSDGSQGKSQRHPNSYLTWT